MIPIFPHHTETIVSSEQPEVILSSIAGVTRRTTGRFGFTLTGAVIDSSFTVTLRLRRPHVFMPMVTGNVDQTSKGSIIFLKYSLFPATRLLLVFWTLVLPAVGISISWRYENYWVLITCMAFLAFVHAVAWLNFRLHVKTTREILYKQFTW